MASVETTVRRGRARRGLSLALRETSPCGLTGTERKPHAQLVIVLRTAGGWLAMRADRAISGGRAGWLLAGGCVSGRVFVTFGAGVAVETIRERPWAVVEVPADLAAGAVAETGLTGGAGAGDGLAAGAGVIHRVAATGTGRVDVALEGTDVLGWPRGAA